MGLRLLSVAFLERFPPCLLALSSSEVSIFVSSYYILFHYIIIPWRPVYFLTRDRKGVDLRGRRGKRRNHNQDLVYEKKNLLLIKEKKGGKGQETYTGLSERENMILQRPLNIRNSLIIKEMQVKKETRARSQEMEELGKSTKGGMERGGGGGGGVW